MLKYLINLLKKCKSKYKGNKILKVENNLLGVEKEFEEIKKLVVGKWMFQKDYHLSD